MKPQYSPMSAGGPKSFPPRWAHAWGSDTAYGLFADVKVNQAVQRFRWIEPGRFLMGSPVTEADRFDNEGPQRWVVVAEGFWIADTACSQGFWNGIMGSQNPSHFTGDDLPVESVSWNSLNESFLPAFQAFLTANAQVFLGTTVPVEPQLASEEQWEYACRAGTQSAFSTGETILATQANFDGNFPYRESDGVQHYREKTVAVKSFEPNAWGLFQMHGNVWEWCSSEYARFKKVSSEIDAGLASVTETGGTAVQHSVERVVRGGSWIGYGRNLRSAARDGFEADYAYDDVGFRLVLRDA